MIFRRLTNQNNDERKIQAINKSLKEKQINDRYKQRKFLHD